MCHFSVIRFVQSCLTEDDVRGKRVLEAGSLDVNGSVRPFVTELHPVDYTGIDLVEGPGVDEICDAEHVSDRFGRESFDIIVSTEMMEHVRNWRAVLSSLKNALRPGGILLISAPSRGFGYHEFPDDFWRYSLEDMKQILSDMVIESIHKNPEIPGVCVKARKPASWNENDLSSYKLHSVVTFRRTASVSDFDLRVFKFYWKIRNSLLTVCPQGLRNTMRNYRNRHTVNRE